MRILTSIMLLGVLAGCSTSPFKESTEYQEKVSEHLASGIQYPEGDFEEKYTKSSSSAMWLTSIGRSIYPLGSSQVLVESAASSAAKMVLIQSAPSEFKSIVQKAISNELGFTGSYSKVDTIVTEVKNLTGVMVRPEDISCKIRVEPMEDGSFRNSRECRALARVKVSELKKAYRYTIEKKYKSKVSKSAVNKTIFSNN